MGLWNNINEMTELSFSDKEIIYIDNIIVVYKHTGPAFFRGIPVIYEPGGVYGSKHPAVSAKQVHQQQRADNA